MQNHLVYRIKYSKPIFWKLILSIEKIKTVTWYIDECEYGIYQVGYESDNDLHWLKCKYGIVETRHFLRNDIFILPI